MFMQNFGIKIGSAGLRKIFNRGQNKTLLSLGNHFKRCFHACVDCPPPPTNILAQRTYGPPTHKQKPLSCFLAKLYLTYYMHCTVHVYSSLYMCTAYCTMCTVQYTVYIAHMFNVHSAHVQCT